MLQKERSPIFLIKSRFIGLFHACFQLVKMRVNG